MRGVDIDIQNNYFVHNLVGVLSFLPFSFFYALEIFARRRRISQTSHAIPTLLSGWTVCSKTYSS